MVTTDTAARGLVLFFDLGDTLVAGGKWLNGARPALDALRSRGVRLGILSNTGDLRRAQLSAHLPPDFDFALFDEPLILLSSELQIEKPDPRIFELAMQRAGSDLALFCTEELLHTLAAQRAGLLTLRVAPPPHGDLSEVAAVIDSAFASS